MLAIFVFYNIANGKQSRLSFSEEFKHCNVYTFDDAHWVAHELDATGVRVKVLENETSALLIKKLKRIPEATALVAIEIDKRNKVSWKPWWVRSCNEYSKYVGSLDVGFTFNPRHLYNKLLKLNGERNYTILSAWRRNNGNVRRW